uniref:Protein kinase domain-containing protein n=1 Tax=Oryza brachyantha TaxID=4533 RepID=J3M5A5_ORYBR
MVATALGNRSSSVSCGGGEVPMAPWVLDLSRLKIGDFVKQGYHGTLFRGEYDGRDVAVKLLEWGGDGYSTPEQIDRLRASLRDVAAAWHPIDHPNIAKFVGAHVGTSPPPDTACFVVVEYLTGGTLKNYLINHMESKLSYKNSSTWRWQWPEG